MDRLDVRMLPLAMLGLVVVGVQLGWQNNRVQSRFGRASVVLAQSLRPSLCD